MWWGQCQKEPWVLCLDAAAAFTKAAVLLLVFMPMCIMTPAQVTGLGITPSPILGWLGRGGNPDPQTELMKTLGEQGTSRGGEAQGLTPLLSPWEDLDFLAAAQHSCQCVVVQVGELSQKLTLLPVSSGDPGFLASAQHSCQCAGIQAGEYTRGWGGECCQQILPY